MLKRGIITAVALGLTLLHGRALSQSAEDEPSPPAIQQQQNQQTAEDSPSEPPIAAGPADENNEGGSSPAAGNDSSSVERDRNSDKWWRLGDNPAQAVMAWAAVAAAALTLVGVILLGFTLKYTRKAAEEAGNATAAANKTVDVTREIGVAQTRSYISVVGGGYILNKAGYSGWVDVVNKGLSPAINAVVASSVRLELAWFGGAVMGGQPMPFDLEPHIARKPKIQPGEVSRFYFSWTKEQFGDRFDSLDSEKCTVVITCRLRSDTVYPGVKDIGDWQLTNYPGFVRSTERSLVSKGDLHPRQLQKR